MGAAKWAVWLGLTCALSLVGGCGEGTDTSCKLTCSAFPSSGDCYCQTTCNGPVQIFTCKSGDCVCQGSGANPDRVKADCASMADAQSIFGRCFP